MSKREHVSVPIVRLQPKSADRVWGKEEVLIHTPKFTLKFLHRRAGSIGPLQYHQKKYEATYLLKGKARVYHDPGTGVLESFEMSEGEACLFPPGSVHREDAIEDCIFVEVSNPVFNDRVRMDDEGNQYGVLSPEPFGLPTTLLREIITTDTWEKVKALEFK